MEPETSTQRGQWVGDRTRCSPSPAEQSVLHDWEEIVHQHGPMALETAWRILGHAGDAEDAAQEAMLQAFRLHGSSEVSNWGGLLRRLTTCRALDMLRRRKTARAHLLVGVGGENGAQNYEPATSAEDAPDARLHHCELTERLRSALAQLSQREAEVFSLHYFGELDNGEIARQLGCTVGAVGVALHKARARLQRWLADEGIEL
jgi:RNA polymerase sigma-70 factor (ECF subfamily)